MEGGMKFNTGTVFFFIAVIGFTLSGCSFEVPEISELPQSRPVTADRSTVVNFSYDDTFEAVSETLIRLNLLIKVSDKKAGKIMANGIGGLSHSGGRRVAVAVYIKEVSSKPTTRVDLVAVLPVYYLSSEKNQVRNNIMSELQKVLLTYR